MIHDPFFLILYTVPQPQAVRGVRAALYFELYWPIGEYDEEFAAEIIWTIRRKCRVLVTNCQTLAIDILNGLETNGLIYFDDAVCGALEAHTQASDTEANTDQRGEERILGQSHFIIFTVQQAAICTVSPLLGMYL